MRGLVLVLAILAVASVTVQAGDYNADSPKVLLARLEKDITKGVDDAIGAAQAWNKATLIDAALHTSLGSPCKTGYLMDAAGKCTTCDYTLAMVPGCNACLEPGTCSGCGAGYTFVAAADSPNDLPTGTCICTTAHLNDPNCAQCGVAGSCDQCYNGYFPAPGTKVCTKCSDSCQVCDSVSTCNVCAEGFSLDAVGQCVACKVGCLECADGLAGLDNCLRCKQNLYPDTTDPGACTAAAVDNCLQVSEASATICAVCDQGFSLTADGQCVPCQVGCLVCLDGLNGTDTCLRCLQNMYPDATQPGACVPAAVDNCLQVSELSATICAVCDQGFSLTSTGQCVPCKVGCLECADGVDGTASCHRCKQDLYPNVADVGACTAAAVPNCLQVSEASATFCAVCAQGYYLTADGQCDPCKDGCLVCAVGGGPNDMAKAIPNVCLRCEQGLVPNTTEAGACVPGAVANCATISQTSATLCEVCDPLFTVSTDGSACLPCGVGCAQCHATAPSDVVVCDVASCNTAVNTVCPTNPCSNLQTDTTNCGACGTVCPAGSTCTAGACFCIDNGQPVVTARAATCGLTYRGTQLTTTYEYNVTGGATYAGRYDSFSIPDRYVLRYNSPCGPIVYDTSFTGLWNSGCLASAPCCPATLGGGCTGSTGQYCPPNPVSGGPPGGAGAGLTPDQTAPIITTKLYATAYGVCGGTANEFTLTGAGGGTCP